jgi:cytochrome c oxidase assembly protein subunit 15
MFTFQLKNIKGGRFFKSIKYLPFYLVTVQVVLGIITLINYSTNYKLILSITHQFVGMLLLVSLFFTLFVIRKSK